MANWKLAVKGEAIFKIDPLKLYSMNPHVKKVEAKENYTLLVYFTNGEKGLFDVKPLFEYPIFSELKKLDFFNKVHIGNGHTVCWSDSIDISPDTIYLDSIKISD